MSNFNKIITLLLVLLSVVVSCKKYDAFGNEIKNYNELKNVNWLIGSWHQATDSTDLYETWQRENDSTFVATSYFIQNKKDTLHYETIELVENNAVLIYSSTIKGENNNNPTSFQKTSSTENEVQFENPKNQYPQKISYKKMTPLLVTATISGTINGKKASHKYNLSKVK